MPMPHPTTPLPLAPPDGSWTPPGMGMAKRRVHPLPPLPPAAPRGGHSLAGTVHGPPPACSPPPGARGSRQPRPPQHARIQPWELLENGGGLSWKKLNYSCGERKGKTKRCPCISTSKLEENKLGSAVLPLWPGWCHFQEPQATTPRTAVVQPEGSRSWHSYS